MQAVGWAVVLLGLFNLAACSNGDEPPTPDTTDAGGEPTTRVVGTMASDERSRYLRSVRAGVDAFGLPRASERLDSPEFEDSLVELAEEACLLFASRNTDAVADSVTAGLELELPRDEALPIAGFVLGGAVFNLCPQYSDIFVEYEDPDSYLATLPLLVVSQKYVDGLLDGTLTELALQVGRRACQELSEGDTPQDVVLRSVDELADRLDVRPGDDERDFAASIVGTAIVTLCPEHISGLLS